MGQFITFLNDLLSHPSPKTIVEINHQRKHIKGMVRLATLNMPDGEYIKIVFDDRSFLLIMIHDQEVYYADSLIGHIKEITDEMIGKEEMIHYRGKEYRLGNKDDYQFVIQRHVGGFNDVEGECRFSDYFPTSGPKEFLSLGWLSYSGKRADINPRIISLNNIRVIES